MNISRVESRSRTPPQYFVFNNATKKSQKPPKIVTQNFNLSKKALSQENSLSRKKNRIEIGPFNWQLRFHKQRLASNWTFMHRGL